MKLPKSTRLNYVCPQCRAERQGRETVSGDDGTWVKCIFYSCGTVLRVVKKDGSYSGEYTYKCKIKR